MIKNSVWKGGLAVVFCLSVSAIYADDAPVVDLNAVNGQGAQPTVLASNGAASSAASVSNNTSGSAASTGSGDATATGSSGSQYNPHLSLDTSTQSMTDAQRLSRLEQQMNNLIRMNLPQQMSDLQQKMQQLNGQVQVQSHDLKLLNQQQSSFYKDLNQRIDQISNLSNNDSSGSSSSSKPAPAKSKPSHHSTPHSSLSSPNQEVAAGDVAAYQAAFHLLSSKKFSAAQQSMKKYMDRFPNGKYVANAHYWSGELYMQQGKSKLAINQFHTVVSEFPQANKVPDAMLKLAMLDKQAGNKSSALSQFKQLRRQFPSTTAAQLAKIYMQQLGGSNG